MKKEQSVKLIMSIIWEKNEDGSCKKCQNDNEGAYCLNKEFGCVDISSARKCLEYDNLSDFSAD